MKQIICAVLILWMAVSSHLYAAETHPSPVTNIGFMENPSKELTSKFAMCDEFLNVEWVNKKKLIGFSHYDLYQNGQKEEHSAFALVTLDEDHPQFDLDLEPWEKIGIIGKVSNLINDGAVTFDGGHFYARNATAGIDVYSIKSERLDRGKVAFANKPTRVCIAYPDNQRVWIIDNTNVGNVYAKDEIAKKVTELKKWVRDLTFFELYEPIDINLDGKVDYFSGKAFIYSSGDRYYELGIQRSADEDFNTKLTSPTNNKSCQFSREGGLYFTSDGKNIFLNNQCNLTELTTTFVK